VADVLNKHWPVVEVHPNINAWQLRTLGAVMRCRTADMGGHMDACTSCGTVRISYNSCRNRHCPKCQGAQREKWILKRQQDLLPVKYFHLVFTLPAELNALAMHQPKIVYGTLFDAAWQTLQTFGEDHRHLGAKTGMISILHTWGQELTLHPHIHCIVPGGGLTVQGKWRMARGKDKYLFCVKAMSGVFRAKYVQILKEKVHGLDKVLINSLFKKKWVVYAKQAFGNADSVVEYLGRYTHKIAISNHRIKDIDKNGRVTFSYKDYRKKVADIKQEMTLEGMEFIRRFALHIMPKGFVRIRHYGILSSSSKKTTIPCIRQQMPQTPLNPKGPRVLEVFNPNVCPCCKTETMAILEIFPKRGPPLYSTNKVFRKAP
jgi:hypothetical protein